MDFYRINDIKLKITMNKDECLEYGIENLDSDVNAYVARSAIRRLLSVAEERCGFSAEGGKMLVQLYPTPKGECELFVTKLKTLSKRERNMLSSEEGLTVMEGRRGCYRFGGEEDLYKAVKAKYREGVDADLYRGEDGFLYIHLAEELFSSISEFELFIEYGERLPSLPLSVTAEYGKLLAKGDAFDFVLKTMGYNDENDNSN